VGTAGDVNGDGYSDVIVRAYKYDVSVNDEGRVYVFHGSASGLSASADWTYDGSQSLACLGYSVGTAGDVNGDGYSDVIVGAYGYDNPDIDEGMAYVPWVLFRPFSKRGLDSQPHLGPGLFWKIRGHGRGREQRRVQRRDRGGNLVYQW
jgi:hypothetical protein